MLSNESSAKTFAVMVLKMQKNAVSQGLEESQSECMDQLLYLGRPKWNQLITLSHHRKLTGELLFSPNLYPPLQATSSENQKHICACWRQKWHITPAVKPGTKHSNIQFKPFFYNIFRVVSLLVVRF